MRVQPTTLICTDGTSLFAPNLKRLDPEVQYQNEPDASDSFGQTEQTALDRYGLRRDRQKLTELLKMIKQFYEAKDFGQLAGRLILLPPELRLCGAEINSIEAMIRKGFLSDSRERLILLVSDTEDGKDIGAILSYYFTNSKCEIRFNQCKFQTVSGLQDEKPLVFQREGLTNLVRILGEQLRKWGSQSMAINATGGYKAQIALAVAFGQATRCAVFYKHERFDQIIRFPRIPFTIDLSMVENYLELWADLAEPGAVFHEAQIGRLLPDSAKDRESIHPMLDRIEEAGESYYSLSALGMVYWEAFFSLNPAITLKPATVNNRRGCHFRDDHYPIGFKTHVQKVYDCLPEIISECHSLDYSGQRGITRNRFYIKEGKILGEYVDRNNFGARFEVVSNAKNLLERKWILNKLGEC